jgi:cell division protein FtsI (penicillin-binding protein 3)
MAVLTLWRVSSWMVMPDMPRGYKYLQKQGDARTIRTEEIPAHRGMITDRNGQPLAVSSPVITLWGNPQQLIESKEHWPTLAVLLDISEKSLAEKINSYVEKGKEFFYLRRHMTPVDAQEILDLDIAGVYSEREYKRFYPAGELVAHIVGFTNIDDKGQEGMELAYDEWLQGKPGEKQVVKDLKGHVIKNLQLVRKAEPGNDLALSIDLRIQYIAHKALKDAVVRYRAQSGSAVVLDIYTGELLAVVNQPSFNPNNRSRLKPSEMRNRALIDVFEPGSTVKPFTIAAALESGKYQPDTLIDTSPGYIQVDKKTLFDPVNYGVIDVTKVITKSSQVGTSKIALSLDPDRIRNFFARLGLGELTTSGFPGESSGVLPIHNKWSPIERATFAFGHGLSLTVVQLAQAYSVLASGGYKRPLSLLRVSQRPDTEQVVNKKISQQVLAMMKTVTSEAGTGRRARIPAFSVAGKTGTVHKVGSNGYLDDKYIAVFAGLAPASSPRLVTVVMVNEPKGNTYYGGEVAAPVFAEIMAGSLRLLNVVPDDIEIRNG